MYQIKKMNEDEAKKYLLWHYEAPYYFYNVPKEYYEEAFREIFSSEEQFYAVYQQQQFFVIYSFAMKGNSLELGLGICPEECGKGYGENFVQAALLFIKEELHFSGEIWLRVKEDNQRALKVYEKLNFKKVAEQLAISYGELVNFIHLELQ